MAGQVGEATGNHHPSICPYGLFDTADGAVQIAVGSEGLWKRFCEGFGFDAAAEGMTSNPQRVANGKRVNELVQAAFGLHSTDELLEKLDRIGVPAGRIRSIREVYEWEQTKSQGLLIDVEHATLGTITLPGPPLRFFDTDGTERTRREHSAPPVLGADNHLLARAMPGGTPMTRLGAHDVVATMADPGSWESWDHTPIEMATDRRYADDLARARAKTGLDESVITGAAKIRGRRCAMLLCDFGFLGGSIGIAAGDRLTQAIRRATAEKLPLLALPTSGGTRMQEGTTAFLQMVKVTAAVVAHKSAHLPYLVYLRHPTTGGVFASWGSLGHVTFAEPGALIGFLGPRVYEALYGDPFPTGVQTAENLCAHGLIDAVVPVHELADTVDSHAGRHHAPPHRGRHPEAAGALASFDVPAWQSVTASRRPDRPGVRELLRHATTE